MQMFCFLFFFSSFFLPGAIKVKYCAIFSGFQTEICFFKSRVWTHNSSLATCEEKFSELATKSFNFSLHFFSGSPFRYIIKELLAPNVVYSQVQIACFGRTGAFVWQIFLPSIHKKKNYRVFWQQRKKTFHSIFTYCRCSPSLLNDGGSDLLVTCGLILHLLYCSVSC